MLSQESAFQEAKLPRLSTNFWKLCLLFRYLVKLHRAETRTEICVQFQHHYSLLIFLTVTLSSSLSTWDDVQMSSFFFISVPASITLPDSLENFIRKLIFFSFSFFLSPFVLPCTHYLPRNKPVHLRCFLPCKMTGSPMAVAVWCQLWALNLT